MFNNYDVLDKKYKKYKGLFAISLTYNILFIVIQILNKF